MEIPLSELRDRARFRPPGYLEDVTSQGTIIGDTIDIPDDRLAALRLKYNLPLPNPLELASNFGRAMASWIASGFPIVSEAEYRARLGPGGCADCPHWHPGQLLGLGRCDRCQCTRLKHWLRTEKCPVGKW